MMPVAIKAQFCDGSVTTCDLRGGEPTDRHSTFFEIDPVDEADELVRLLLNLGDALNSRLAAKASGAGLPMVPQIRVMDSDGRV